MEHLLDASFYIIAAETAAGEEGKGGLFVFNATLFVQIAQFLFLLLVMNALFFKPIGKVLNERSEYIQSNRRGSTASLEEAKKLTAQYEAELGATRQQARDVIAKAETEAKASGAEALAKAQQEANARMAQAAQEVERQRQEALKSLEGEVSVLSRQIAEKLLSTAGRNGQP
jgi:F-type H+-transporting ATPase subunit b